MAFTPSPNLKKAKSYAAEVRKGRGVYSSWIKKAVARHDADLARADDDTFPYVFNEKKANRALMLFELLKHGKGKWRGIPFNLMDWQAFIVYVAYGWENRETQQRRFRSVYIKVARKNAKTEFLAAIGLIGFFFDNEPDAEVYWFATKKDQAKIGWDRQKVMTEQLRKDSPMFGKFCDTTMYRIFSKGGSATVAYLGADGSTEDGLAPHYGLCDEYHAHRTDEMVDVIESGMGSRAEPMMWYITTAGFNPYCPCAEFEKACKNVLDGTTPNDQILAFIYDLDDDDDWQDQRMWAKANPALNWVDTLENTLLANYAKALTQGAEKQNNFKTKHLNMWVSSSATWIQHKDWMDLARPDVLRTLKGLRCYGGLDLASRRDIAALCLYFPEQDGLDVAFATWLMFCPEETATERSKTDQVPYRDWGQEGWLHLTPGNVVDYTYIKQAIMQAADNFDLRAVMYDDWNSTQLVIDCIAEGLEMERIGQGWKSLSPPTKQIDIEVAQKMITHDGSPVMAWMMGNVDLEYDAAGNVKPSKKRSAEKIDGVFALVMARAGAMHNEGDEDIEPGVWMV